MLEVVYTSLLVAALVLLGGLGGFAVYRLFRGSARAEPGDRAHQG